MAKVLQLRIELRGISPAIWRRFLVSDTVTFEELHTVIQKVMGWENEHLFEFRIGDRVVAPDDAGYNPAESAFRLMHTSPEFQELLESADLSDGGVSLDTRKVDALLKKLRKEDRGKGLGPSTPVSTLVNSEKQAFTYIYDFGDCWEHSLLVERILDAKDVAECPACLDGARACPPEDCGSVPGYHELMDIRKDRKHPEYKERILEWLGEEYDPESFDAEAVTRALHAGMDEPILAPERAFVALGKLLKNEKGTGKKPQSLFGLEEEYEAYLGEIEYRITKRFMEDRSLKDKEVEKALKNIQRHHLEELDFFGSDLEKDLMMGLSLALQETGITTHELLLVLNHILWAVDNRSWMRDKQAYVKWLPYFFELYNPKETKAYREQVTRFCRRLGVPEPQIRQLLDQDGAEPPTAQETDYARLECEYFSLAQDRKSDFVVERFLDHPGLVKMYADELGEKGDFAALERFYKRIMEASGGLPHFEFLLGINYEKMGMPDLARHHIDRAIAGAKDMPADWMNERERGEFLSVMQESRKRIGG